MHPAHQDGVSPRPWALYPRILWPQLPPIVKSQDRVTPEDYVYAGWRSKTDNVYVGRLVEEWNAHVADSLVMVNPDAELFAPYFAVDIHQGRVYLLRQIQWASEHTGIPLELKDSGGHLYISAGPFAEGLHSPLRNWIDLINWLDAFGVGVRAARRADHGERAEAITNAASGLIQDLQGAAEDLKEVLAAKRLSRRRIEDMRLLLQSGVEFLVKRSESQVSKQRGG